MPTPTPVAEKRAREIVTTDDYVSYYQQFQVELKFSLQLCEENGMAEEDRRAVEAGAAMMQAGGAAGSGAGAGAAGTSSRWGSWARPATDPLANNPALPGCRTFGSR